MRAEPVLCPFFTPVTHFLQHHTLPVTSAGCVRHVQVVGGTGVLLTLGVTHQPAGWDTYSSVNLSN